MIRRSIVLAAACAIIATFSGAARAGERSIFDDVKLEATPETNGVDPYPNEMVLLRIRGVYRPLINIAHLVQPSLVNFGWTNLMRDRGFTAEVDGFRAEGFERVIAIFPEKSGPLEIGSFVHKLSVVDGDGQRALEVRSQPIVLNVAEWRGPGGPKDPTQWWLPSGEVRITDDWSGDPNHVPRGETVRRTVTIEAHGVMAEQMPPAPVMRSPGILSFRGPVDHDMRATPEGPVARAVYRWDMRPATVQPAIVEAIEIPWFDTRAREMRKAVIPAQRMAWAAAGAPARDAARSDEPSTWLIGLAGALAFLGGLALLLTGAGGRPKLQPRAFYAMRVAAWRGDAASFRAEVTDLARAEREAARLWSAAPEVRAGLAELDRHLFDATAAPRPSLRRLARVISAARARACVALRPARSGLEPLDGPTKRA